MSKTLIHQTGFNYPLYLNFSSPVGDLLSYGEEVVDEICNTRLEDIKDKNVSLFEMVCKTIATSLIEGMPFMGPAYNYYGVIMSILYGVMFHDYYTSGPYGEKIFDYLEEGLDCKEKHINPSSDLVIQADEAWMSFITEYLEPIKGAHLNWGDKNEKEIRPAYYWDAPKRNYKVSHWGLIYMKTRGFDEAIVKGIKEIYVRRLNLIDFRLMEAIISYAYFEKELFIYFNPRFFELGICDREHLKLINGGMYMVADFGKIINKIFCEDCVRKLRNNSKIKKVKSDKGATDEEKKIALRVMFDGLYNTAVETHFDDVVVTMDGFVADLNRFHELECDTEYGEVGFVKHGKKQSVKVTRRETLKDIRKSLKKK